MFISLAESSEVLHGAGIVTAGHGETSLGHRAPVTPHQSLYHVLGTWPEYLPVVAIVVLRVGALTSLLSLSQGHQEIIKVGVEHNCIGMISLRYQTSSLGKIIS